LNKSGILGIDYALNPYVGCEHKCQYCYAVFMRRFSGHTEPWGDFVDVKINAPEVLAHQLRRLKPSHISLGTVCDAYQPIEAKYSISRKCLERLSYYSHSVSILTKSALVLRDIDLLKRIKDIEVGFTITTLNPKIKGIFEPCSSSSKERLSAIKTLSQNNIPTWVFVAPILPYLTDADDEFGKLFQALQRSGCQYMLFDTLNPYPNLWRNVIRLIKTHFPKRIKFYHYYYRNKPEYEKQLKERISKIGRGYKIKHNFAF